MSIGRSLALSVLVAQSFAQAQPALTTIRDTLYKADGTLLNATLTISWYSFEAADQSQVTMQTATSAVVNGQLYVQLVPNTNAAPSNPYNVTYSSDGVIQFTETWMVPPSNSPLHVRDVRMGTTGGAGNGALTGGGGVTSGPITESGVTGLVTDLASRPLKGASYIPGRIALVDSTGALETVAGAFNDCVYVNGTSGPCFDPTQLPAYSDGEVPAGIIDGSNPNFSLAASPSPAPSLILFRNGLAQKQGSDYTLSGAGLQFAVGNVPQPGDALMAWYRGPSAAAGGAQNVVTQNAPGMNTTTPQVFCSFSGKQTSAISLTSLGSCTIPGNLLLIGDRVDIRFLFAHSGAANGFTYSVTWGSNTVVQRNAPATETNGTGRADATVTSGATQITVESYGVTLPFLTGLVSSTASNAAPIVIGFNGALAASGSDSVSLVNATVIRYPAIANP